MQDSVTTLKVTSTRATSATSNANIEKEMVNFRTVVKLPKVAGILRGYVNTNIPDSGIFQTGLSFGIRGEKMLSH